MTTTKQIQGGNLYGTGAAAQAQLGQATGVAPASETEAAKAAKAAKAQKDAKALDIAISTSAKDRAEAHAKALDIARNTPDVREDRVAALKKQIADGTYKIDAGAIADGMAREAILEHLAETEGRG